jgi:hypothetical protein
MALGNCTQVTAACPVQASSIGYYPILSANVVPAIIFLLAVLIQLVIGIRRRTWSYLVGLGIGSLLEATGYIGRIILHKNPFSGGGFKLQIICLTIAPAFIAAGLYLNLKNLVIVFGPHLSLLKPALYTYIFISSDTFSIALQAVGAGLAAAGIDLAAASDIIIAGLSFQVFTMVMFGVMSGVFFLRVAQNRGGLKSETDELRGSPKFRGFLVSLALAYTTVLIRCIFRVAAFAGGWGNALALNQTDFIVLDTV